MQIIDRLEHEPRGIYTGAIGFHSREESVFNVAIRTAFIKDGVIEMGVGSGILHEADAGREYAECELKGQFLTLPSMDFQLIETILWTPESGFRNLHLHLKRLEESSEYFGFKVQIPSVETRLKNLQSNMTEKNIAHKIRLLASRDGSVSFEFSKIDPIGRLPVKLRLASARVNSSDRYLFHKTTSRRIYDQELAAAQMEGYFDVIFQNENEEVTEGAISNLFLKRRDVYLTPPVSAGLLAGTYRRYLIESGAIPVEERILKEEDLRSADSLFVCNAIRGLIPAEL
jgi:para-aminobenzoate synthetase/4-amino-4-deoxychorismate lyase